jgi:phosphoribosylformylglycinamidine synthase
MAFGNMTGVEAYAPALAAVEQNYCQGSALVEIDGNAVTAAGLDPQKAGCIIAGKTIAEKVFRVINDNSNTVDAAERPLNLLREIWESPLADVYPQVAANNAGGVTGAVSPRRGGRTGPRPGRRGILPPSPSPSPSSSSPLVTIPVFPGTNCEWDMERAFREAGARTQLAVFRNRGPGDIQDSIRDLAAAIAASQIVALPGGFSAGDEPDGSGKFIANVFRSPRLEDALKDLLENRGGLMLGICNGFQALIKLGLVPYGTIRDAADNAPTLTFNDLGRHVSRMVRTTVISTLSPWLALEEPGAVHTIPVSHGEGRVVMSAEEAESLFASGQISCCYADGEGRPATAEPDNPNGSLFAIEALSSPDGRILGKMAHSERRGKFVHVNIPGNKEQRIFEAGVGYFL